MWTSPPSIMLMLTIQIKLDMHASKIFSKRWSEYSSITFSRDTIWRSWEPRIHLSLVSLLPSYPKSKSTFSRFQVPIRTFDTLISPTRNGQNPLPKSAQAKLGSFLTPPSPHRCPRPSSAPGPANSPTSSLAGIPSNTVLVKLHPRNPNIQIEVQFGAHI